MKKSLQRVIISACLAVSVAIVGFSVINPAASQLIYGNTFPFWNVGSGGLTVIGDASVGGTLAVTGATTASNLTASQAVFTNSSKVLTSNAITGTGNVVMSASPTLTGTIGAANGTFTGNVSANGIIMTTTSSPASNGACTAGTIVWDTSYLYLCTATGVWKRTGVTGGY